MLTCDNLLHVLCQGFSEKLLAKEDPGLYSFINQGCLGVDGMDDKEEMKGTDVCKTKIQQKDPLHFADIPKDMWTNHYVYINQTDTMP